MISYYNLAEISFCDLKTWFKLADWHGLTHLPLAKMAAISQTIFASAFMNEKSCIIIKISLKFIPKGPIDNNAVLVQMMAWCRIGDKPLLTNAVLIHWRIYAALLGGDELIEIARFMMGIFCTACTFVVPECLIVDIFILPFLVRHESLITCST